MRIKKPRSKSKTPIKVLIVALILSALYLVYAYTAKNWPSAPDQILTSEQKEAINNSDKQNNQTKEDITGKSKSLNVDTQKTTLEIPVSNTLSVSIQSLTQDNKGIVSYKASAAGSPNGICSATFTHELGKPVIRNSETTNGICEGSISAMEFDAVGEWTLTMRYYANDTQTSAIKTIEIK